MDPRLLRHYNQELGHLREMGAEFALQFPRIAARLGMSGIEVADPYVERLMEGLAFLAARVQLRLDAEFPRFTQHLLDIVYPQFLAPTPSMLVAQLRPDLNAPDLARGVTVARGSALQARPAQGFDTACEFRTAHDVELWPLEVAAASYFTFAPDLPLGQLSGLGRIKGGLRLRLRSGGGLRFNELALRQLPLHFSGNDDVAYRLYELVLGACCGVLVLPPQRPLPWFAPLGPEAVQPLGFEDGQALLPVTQRSFQGWRLLHEYGSFPQRFLFAELQGLQGALGRCDGSEVEVVLLFSRGDATLEGVVDASSLSLFCTPAINLFERRCDRVALGHGAGEHHVVVDRTRPMDFEVYELTRVTGWGPGVQGGHEFRPFYCARHERPTEHAAYYTLQREPRLLSPQQQRNGARSSYVGSEAFIALVDAEEAPYAAGITQLAVDARVTNRDLPLYLPLGAGRNDLTLDASAPVSAVQVLRGPSRPQSALREGNVAWRFINQLSLNYLTLQDDDAHAAAAGLRDLLGAYAKLGEAAFMRQVEGLHGVDVQPLVRRLPLPGPLAFGRGLEITLDVDELAFQGGSAFLFGAVMARFFARHVSINSFTETVLRSASRGEVMRWVPRCGTRPIV